MTSLKTETPADLARVLRFAATYMEEHGRGRGWFGTRGTALCPAAAIAVALGINPQRIGRAWFFRASNEDQDRVGEIILRTGLLESLPVPGNRFGARNLRPQPMTPRRALLELALWNDDKALNSLVIEAFRSQARKLLASQVRKAGVTTVLPSMLAQAS